MPFNTLLLSCLQHGTSASEKSVSVHIVPKKGETILFFKTDCKTACKDLLIEEGEPVCDYLVFYAKEGKIALCLLELKGNDTDHAIKQILSTYEHIQERLKDLKGKACWNPIQNIIWKVYICCGAKSSISPSKNHFKTLEKIFKRNIKITHEDEIDNFIRL